MNKKGFVNIIIIGIVVIIIAAAGYFALTRKIAEAPTTKDKIQSTTEKELELPLVKIKECPNTAERGRMQNIIGEPIGAEAYPPQWNDWVYQSYERLYVELNKNPIRCDIDKRFQVIIRSEKPKKSSEKNVLLTPKMNAYLYDKNLNNEQLITSELNWAGPMPQGNTYGPNYFTFEFKPHNLIEISSFFQPGKALIAVDFLSKRKASYHLYTGEASPYNSRLTVIKDNREWRVNLLTERSKVESGIKIKIKGLALNDEIFKPINLEKTYSSDFDFDQSGFSFIITNIEFNEDFSKVFFDAKILNLLSKEVELGRIEINLI